MNKHLIGISAFIVFCLSSCANDRQKKEAIKIVKEWIGKEIKFPQGISCTSTGRDTTCVNLYSDNFKIVIYVDSLGCTSCRLKLSEWKKIMKESDSVFVRKPEFIFFFQPKKRDERELQSIFRGNGFSHPVFIDKENEIGKINPFPSNPEHQCFLLDKENKVILIGNPSLVSGIWFLYKRVINEREKKVLTTEKGGDLVYGDKTTTLPPYFPK